MKLQPQDWYFEMKKYYSYTPVRNAEEYLGSDDSNPLTTRQLSTFYRYRAAYNKGLLNKYDPNTTMVTYQIRHGTGNN